MATARAKWGEAYTFVFPVPKLDDTDFAATGDWTPVAADGKVSQDGGNVADCTNAVAALGGTGSVLWSLTLTATEMEAQYVAVQIVDAAVENQAFLIETDFGFFTAKVASTTTSTTTVTGADTTADFYNNMIIRITSGTGVGQARLVTDYTSQVFTHGNWTVDPDTTSVLRVDIATPSDLYLFQGKVVSNNSSDGTSIDVNVVEWGGFANAVNVGGTKVLPSVDVQAVNDSNNASDNFTNWATQGCGSALLDGIATLASQTSFTLSNGSADDDAYNGMICVVRHPDALPTDDVYQVAVGIVDDYTGSTKTITLRTDPGIFTMAVGDFVEIIPHQAQTGDNYARLAAPAGASVSADIAAVKAETALIVADTGTTIPATIATAQADLDTITGSDGVTLATAQGNYAPNTTTPPTAAANATELLDQANGIETGWSVRQAMRILLAALGGKLSGAATTTNTIRDATDTKDRITATVDSDGNRSAVTLDGD